MSEYCSQGQFQEEEASEDYSSALLLNKGALLLRQKALFQDQF